MIKTRKIRKIKKISYKDSLRKIGGKFNTRNQSMKISNQKRSLIKKKYLNIIKKNIIKRNIIP